MSALSDERGHPRIFTGSVLVTICVWVIVCRMVVPCVVV